MTQAWLINQKPDHLLITQCMNGTPKLTALSWPQIESHGLSSFSWINQAFLVVWLI